MAPVLFLILMPVLLFAAASDLLLPKIHSWFRCSVVIVGIAYRRHCLLYTSKSSKCVRDKHGVNHCPGNIPFRPVGYGMNQMITRGLEA